MLTYLMYVFMRFMMDLFDPPVLISAAHAFMQSVLALFMFGLIIRVIAALV